MKVLERKAKILVRTYVNGVPHRTPTVSIRNIYSWHGTPAILCFGFPTIVKKQRNGTWLHEQHIREIKAISGEELKQKLLDSLKLVGEKK